MALSLSDILAQNNAKISSTINPLGSLTKAQPVQLAPAPVKAGVSLSDIVATKKQPQPTSLISSQKQNTLGGLITTNLKPQTSLPLIQSWPWTTLWWEGLLAWTPWRLNKISATKEEMVWVNKSLSDFTSKYLPLASTISQAHDILNKYEEQWIKVSPFDRVMASLPVTSNQLVDINRKVKEWKDIGNWLLQTLSSTLSWVTWTLANTAWIVPNAIFQWATDAADYVVPWTRKLIEEKWNELFFGNWSDKKWLKGHLQDIWLSEWNAINTTNIAEQIINLWAGIIWAKIWAKVKTKWQTVEAKSIWTQWWPAKFQITKTPKWEQIIKWVLTESLIQNAPQYVPAVYSAIVDYVNKDKSIDNASKIGISQLAMIWSTALTWGKWKPRISDMIPETKTLKEQQIIQEAKIDTAKSADWVIWTKTVSKEDIPLYSKYIQDKEIQKQYPTFNEFKQSTTKPVEPIQNKTKYYDPSKPFEAGKNDRFSDPDMYEPADTTDYIRKVDKTLPLQEPDPVWIKQLETLKKMEKEANVAKKEMEILEKKYSNKKKGTFTTEEMKIADKKYNELKDIRLKAQNYREEIINPVDTKPVESIKSEQKIIKELKKEEQTPDIKEAIDMAKENIVDMKKQPTLNLPKQPEPVQPTQVKSKTQFTIKDGKIVSTKVPVVEPTTEQPQVNRTEPKQITLKDIQPAPVEPAQVTPIDGKIKLSDITKQKTDELPALGTPEEAAKIAQDDIDLWGTKKIVENSKLPEWQTEFKLIPLAGKRTSRAINLDTFLSSIKYYIDWVYNGTFQNFIQKSKNTGKRVANQLADDYNVKAILKETTPEEVSTAWKSIEKNLDGNLIGGKTQNEWVDITPQNVEQLKNTIQEWGDMTYSETYGDINNKQLNDLAKINFVYELNKWNQAKLDAIIPKKLQELFQKYDEIYRKAYDAIWPYLVELWQLSKYDIEEQYKRFVMLPWARKALEKLTGKSIFTTSDWVEHSTYLDMMTYIKNEKRRSGKDLTPTFDVWNLSSILKEKSTWVDLFRFNSPIIQSLDYFRQVGDLTKADSIFKAFDELGQSKDPKVKAFVEWLYNNNGYQNVLEQSMGLGWIESKSKIVQWIQKTSWLSAKALLYGSVSNLVQAITSGTVKTLILWNNPFRWTSLLRIKNPETKNIFQKYGIAQEFELSSAKDLAGNKNVALFSGTPIENAQKIAVALPIMKSTVEKLWTPEQISNIKKWGVDAIAKEFDSIIKSSDTSVENQIMDLIYERTNYIGNVSSNARSSIWVLNKLWFTALKTFSTNRIWQIQQNILKTISGKEISNMDAMFNEGKFQKLDQVSKGRISAAAKIMWPLLAAYAVSELYQQDNNDEKKKWLIKAQWDQIANQFVWNDYVLIRDYIANLTSSTLNLPADFIKQLWEALMLIYKQKDKSEASKLGIEKLISFLLTKTAPWKLINQSTAIASWETAWTKLADFLQVPNLEKQTAKMNAKWFWISTPQEAFAELMWVRSDTATQNYIYGLMQDAKVDEKYKDMPEIAKMFVSWVWDTYNKTARNLDTFALNPYSYQDMWKYNDQLVEENYVWATLRNRDNNPNLSTFLQKVWIEDSLKNSIIEAKWGNLDKMRIANNQIEKVINQNMLTNYIEWENFSEYLNNLEEQNPKWFNNFIGGIALTKKYIDENPEIDFSDKWVVQDIKWFFKDSTTNIDAAVSDFSWKAPLSTGLTESLQQWLMQFQDKLGQKWGIEEAKKSLWDVQRIFDIILNNSKHTDWIIAATALKSTELKEILTAMREKGYKTFDKDFPILTNIIKRWLELRWEVERDNVLMDKPSQIPTTPTLSSISSGQAITTNWNLSTWILPVAIPQQKNKKLGDLIKQTKYQPQQLVWRPDLPSSTSLSEIVRKINLWRN